MHTFKIISVRGSEHKEKHKTLLQGNTSNSLDEENGEKWEGVCLLCPLEALDTLLSFKSFF